MQKESKFNARANEGALIEILRYGVYKVLLRDCDGLYSIVESRHVTFDELQFPGAPELQSLMLSDSESDESWTLSDSDTNYSSESIDVNLKTRMLQQHHEPSLGGSQSSSNLSGESENVSGETDNGEELESLDSDEPGHELSTSSEEHHDFGQANNDSLQERRYPSRVRNKPKEWYIVSSIYEKSLKITTSDEPTLTEVLNSTPDEKELWIRAIDEEFSSIEENDTWEQDDVPKKPPLPSHLRFNIKRNSNGCIERFKCRLVAGGDRQVYGEDFKESHAPVVNFIAVRLFLYIVLSLQLCIAQVDIKTAFLNGNLEEDVWIYTPRGVPGLSSRTYKLKKSLVWSKASPPVMA